MSGILFENAHFLSGHRLILVDEQLMLLETHRYALIHDQILLQAVAHAIVLEMGDLAIGKVEHAVVEADLGYLVVLLDKLFDL